MLLTVRHIIRAGLMRTRSYSLSMGDGSMYMKLFTLGRILILCSVFLNATLYTQIDDDAVVGTVGSVEVTAREFRQRFELSPWPGKDKKGFLDVIKEHFLYAMMAEKVLALEAEATGYGNDPAINTLMTRMERWYAKDYLYADEVREAVSVTEEDLRDEMIRSQTTVYVSFLYFELPAGADVVWQHIQEGTPFERIVLDNPDHMVYNHRVDRNITVPELLTVVDTLQPGEVAPPIATQYGYYIVKLENSHTNPLITENQFRSRRESLEKQLRSRLEKPRARQFVDEVVGDRELEVYGSGLRLMGIQFERILDRKRSFDFSDHPMAIFDDLDFDEMYLSLREHLNEPVIQVLEERWDIKETLDRLRLFGVWFENDPDTPLLPQVRGILEDLAVDEILATEALTRNYLERPEIRNELAMWRSNFTAELYKRDLLQNVEVSYDEIHQYFEENKEQFRRPLLVNIREILVATQAEAHNILTQLDSGRELR
jgi:hypothetical protein